MPKTRGFAVLGLGAFGGSVAKALVESKQDVIVVDTSESAVDSIKDLVSEAIIGDVTSRELLKEINVEGLEAAIVCVGENLQASILSTLTLKDLGCPHVIAKADSRQHRQILERVGADQVVLPEIQAARDLVQNLVNPAVMERYALGPGFSIIKSPIPESWVGHTLVELHVRHNHGISIIAVERCPGPDKCTVHANPEPAFLFEAGDRLIVLGSDKQLQDYQAVK